MYTQKASEILAADPTPHLRLRQIYACHAGMFEREPPGVEVSGAGSASYDYFCMKEDEVNGWYARKEVTAGPPSEYLVCRYPNVYHSKESWESINFDQYYF